MHKKNILLTFCFACVPGCGQMYQGYMKRGVSLLFWAVAVITAGILLNLGAIIALVVVIWAYSFFDTFNIRNLTPEQRAAFYDDYVPSQRWLKENRLDTLINSGRMGKVFGWVLVGIGVITLYQNFLYSIIRPILNRWTFLWDVYYAIPRLAIGLGVILLGIWMLRRTRVQNRQVPPAAVAEDEVIHYIGEGSSHDDEQSNSES